MENKLFEGGFVSGGMLNLTPLEALDWCQKGAVFVDVRESYMNRFKMFGVPEVIYCPFSILGENFRDLTSDQPLIFADAAGIHSKEAVIFMMEKEWNGRVVNLAGGLVEWERDGLPLIVDKSERLSGSCMCQLRPREK